MAKKQRYYVVWRGYQPGVYATWAECLAQVSGFSGADYKAFDTRELAEEACHLSRSEFLARHPELKPPGRAMQASSGAPATPADAPAGRPDPDSYAVDAACSGNPGPLEYRCVHVATGAELFKQGPFANGTNNIGEFLAIVHALALFKKRGIRTTIYSDSVNAIVWVRRKACRTQLAPDEQNAPLFALIARAEAWLHNHEYDSKVVKWETGAWGEIPADFGRKG